MKTRLNILQKRNTVSVNRANRPSCRSVGHGTQKGLVSRTGRCRRGHRHVKAEDMSTGKQAPRKRGRPPKVARNCGQAKSTKNSASTFTTTSSNSTNDSFVPVQGTSDSVENNDLKTALDPWNGVSAEKIMKINTNDYCLFCLKPCGVNGPNGGRSDVQGTTEKLDVSNRYMNLISRHLKLKINAEMEGGNAIFGNSLTLEVPKFEVSACTACQLIMKAFCDLYNQQQQIQLQLDWNVTKLRNIMRAAENVPSRATEFRRKVLEGENAMTQGERKLMEKFKRAFLRSGVKKNFPKVVIERVNTEGRKSNGEESCNVFVSRDVHVPISMEAHVAVDPRNNPARAVEVLSLNKELHLSIPNSARRGENMASLSNTQPEPGPSSQAILNHAKATENSPLLKISQNQNVKSVSPYLVDRERLRFRRHKLQKKFLSPSKTGAPVTKPKQRRSKIIKSGPRSNMRTLALERQSLVSENLEPVPPEEKSREGAPELVDISMSDSENEDTRDKSATESGVTRQMHVPSRSNGEVPFSNGVIVNGASHPEESVEEELFPTIELLRSYSEPEIPIAAGQASFPSSSARPGESSQDTPNVSSVNENEHTDDNSFTSNANIASNMNGEYRQPENDDPAVADSISTPQQGRSNSEINYNPGYSQYDYDHDFRHSDVNNSVPRAYMPDEFDGAGPPPPSHEYMPRDDFNQGYYYGHANTDNPPPYGSVVFSRTRTITETETITYPVAGNGPSPNEYTGAQSFPFDRQNYVDPDPRPEYYFHQHNVPEENDLYSNQNNPNFNPNVSSTFAESNNTDSNPTTSHDGCSSGGCNHSGVAPVVEISEIEDADIEIIADIPKDLQRNSVIRSIHQFEP